MTKRIPAAALAAAVVFVAGCTGGGTVSGTVTLDGQALKSGTVTFHPVGSGPVAIGSIDANGRYELRVGNDRSVPPGDYLVTVDATEPVESEPAPDKGPPRPPAAPKRITPEKYANKETTDLRFTVKSGGQSIDLTLTGGK